MFIQIILFLASCLILSWFSSKLIKTLTDIAKYLQWREFIIAFFVLGFAASLPNLFVDLNAALHGLQQISFGDIMGGNLIDLSLAMAVAVLMSRKHISTESKMVQSSSIITAGIAILPWILVLRTGGLDRLDGIILVACFFGYAWWLFSKDDRFKKVYGGKKINKTPINKYFFVWNMVKMVLILGILLGSSFAVIYSAQYFAKSLDISLGLVGVLIVALGNCFPETYFAIISARKEENWMVLGDMMASVIVCGTLVLGIIALIAPFQIIDFSPFFIARAFMVVACIFYIWFIYSGKKLTKKEGLFLLLIYILFLLSEVFIK